MNFSNTSLPNNYSGTVAVILTDTKRKIVWVNEGFTELTGYTMKEVVGKKPSLLQGEESDSNTIERIRKQLNMKLPFRESITNYRKNGEKYACELTIHPIFNSAGKLINYIAFEIDGDHTPRESVDLLKIKEKYLSSRLKTTQAYSIYTKLVDLFDADPIYLSQDLKLKTVADLLKTNSRYLSQVINQHTSNNFAHFVNSYRIREVIKRLLNGDSSKFTSFGLAQQCGFKNKSTFYKVFQEFTGHTPKSYLVSHSK